MYILYIKTWKLHMNEELRICLAIAFYVHNFHINKIKFVNIDFGRKYNMISQGNK